MGVMSDGYIYVAASRQRHYYIGAVGLGHAKYLARGYTRYICEARLFFTKGEALTWCEGRKGWRAVRVARLVPEYSGAMINSRFKK
jgi:hypothetical protein